MHTNTMVRRHQTHSYKFYKRGTEQKGVKANSRGLCLAVDEYGLIDDDNDE